MISLFTLTLFLIFFNVCFSFQRSSRRSSRFALLLAFFSIKFQLLNSKFKSLQIIIKKHTDFLCCFVLSLLLVCVCVFASSYGMLFILSVSKVRVYWKGKLPRGKMPLGRELPTCLVEVRCSSTIAKKADDDDGWRRVQFFVFDK